MIDDFRYLVERKEELRIGISIISTGYQEIDPNEEYPPPLHPSHHVFEWKQGRILSEYQLIHIIEGNGVFESKETGTKRIQAGNFIMLFPGIWHRYKPFIESGWKMYWIGFKGDQVPEWLSDNTFSIKNPIASDVQVGETTQLMRDILNCVSDENPGFQKLSSAMILFLLSKLNSNVINRFYVNDKYSIIIENAKSIFLERVCTSVSPEKVASEIGVGYSKFRKLFKQATGVSPGQYFINLKIVRARDMLKIEDIPVKEIAYQMGFESDFYFNRLFKSKTGMTPGAFKGIYH